MVSFVLSVKFRFIMPNILLVLLTTSLHWLSHFKSSLILTPKSCKHLSYLLLVWHVRYFGFLDGNLIYIVTPFILWYMRSVFPIFPNYCLLLYISFQLSLHACISSKFVINFLYWQRFILMFIDFHLSLPFLDHCLLTKVVNQGFCFSLVQFLYI